MCESENNIRKSDVNHTFNRINPRKSILGLIDGSLSFFGLDSQDATVDDWNERRLRYVIKRYGSVKGERLPSLTSSPVPGEICGPFAKPVLVPDTPTTQQHVRGFTKRQVSFLNETSPAPTLDNNRPTFMRQVSGLTTLSLPTYRKQHALLMLLSALWNPRTRLIPRKTDNYSQAPSGIGRFLSVPNSQVTSHFEHSDINLTDKWVNPLENVQEQTAMLAEPAIKGKPRLTIDLNFNKKSSNRNALKENNELGVSDEEAPQSPVSVAASTPSTALPYMGIFGPLNDMEQSSDWAAVRTVRQNSRKSKRNFTNQLLSILTPSKDHITEDIFHNKTTEWTEYRPYFTYWITFVQIIIFIAGAIGYGFAPIGVGIASRVFGKVRMPSLTVDQVCWTDYDNMWIGPRQTDLIRLGARFPPCMRFDPALYHTVIKRQKKFDRESGCCIRNDGGGCYQTHRDACSRTLATWLHYQSDLDAISVDSSGLNDQNHFINQSKNLPNRLIGRAGPVCGLDPEFCNRPRSSGAFAWSETDVTEWPICEFPSNVSSLGGYAPHMECQVTGHPCCLGIKGECIITTKEHCDFVRGFYNPTAALCSQVNCLHQICGMSPFIDKEQPNQFYRIYTSLFLHAGVMHLLLSIGIQMIFMRDLEKMIGWHRIALVYTLSGCVGSLMSGIFLPYQVETGPTAAQFALLGVVLVDFIHCRKFLTHPWSALFRNFLLVAILFLFGLLPWIDNYANAGAFISGTLLSFILLPFCGFVYPTCSSTESNNTNNDDNKNKLLTQFKYKRMYRCMVVLVCSFLWLTFAIGLTVLFLWGPIIDCQLCTYFTCLPLTSNLCDSLQVNVHERSDCIPVI